MREIGSLVVAPAVPSSTRLVAAACSAGAMGVLDLVGTRELALARYALQELRRLCPDAQVGARVAADDPEGIALLSEPGITGGVVLLAPADDGEVVAAVRRLRPGCPTILAETLSVAAAVTAEGAGVDALVAVGNEAGGEVSEQTSLVLLQALLRATSLPVWVRGGIGLHSAGACYVAGAAGLVLDDQLLLAAESSLPEALRRIVSRSDGGDTRCLGLELGRPVRVHARTGSPTLADLTGVVDGGDVGAWRARVRQVISWTDVPDPVLPLGQAAAMAPALARRFRTAGGIVTGLREAAYGHARLAQEQHTLRAGSPLARSHGTRYPIVQGPMTRVSDSPELLRAVAEAGALPFLALGLADRATAEELVRRTSGLLGELPWGVGILGFVPAEVRAQQTAALEACRPPFALIAGGRPDQAALLEALGVPTYLHVPSPTLLDLFVGEGARRFVLEGRECGGHVGPRSSLVLWDQGVQTLLTLPDDELAQCHVLLAGGIHDGVSAAAAATVVAPLTQRGARVGVLLGTAYALTDEAVSSGAVTQAFQDTGVACERTVLLETGPGHASRCARTPYAETFARERRRLRATQPDDARDELEALNLGRLRVATKGLAHGEDGEARPVGAAAQLEDGMFMLGDVATLCEDRRSVAALHRAVSHGSGRVLDATCGSASGPARPGGTDVAIVGMSCLLPAAPDLASFWDNIIASVDAITEVPEHRWRAADYFDPDPAAPDKIYSRWGGFIDPVTIDPVRYGIPPAAVSSIEPVQLLALRCAEDALADAGYADREFPRERTAVVFGIGGGIADLGQRYAVRSGLPMYLNGASADVAARLPAWTEDSFAGILLNVVPGRIANRLDLGGVNLAVDAACASSLAAVQIAVRELVQGTSDMVVVGGADTVQNPFGYLCFSKVRALSARGRCRSFDMAADGIVISEGLGVLVLKRLADAERDGDRVYAVIKGVGGSSDGRGLSLTAPRVDGQVRALRRAYAEAGIRPRSVGLLEAHGTGTVAGDRAELAALDEVFSGDGALPGACSLGSVKSMIGHTKCAAGVAGLMKAALALHHQVLPATLHVDDPNPAATGRDFPFQLNTVTRPWVHTAATPRRAAVSSFGFGGVNVHAVLEEYAGPPGQEVPVSRRWPAELFLLAADTGAEMRSLFTDLASAAAATDGPGLVGLAESTCRSAVQRAAVSREPLVRCGVVAGTSEELRDGLDRLGKVLDRGVPEDWADPRGTTVAGTASPQPVGSVAFLFPGQGSQYPGMLRELAIHLPPVRHVVERAEAVLLGRLERPLSAYLFPPARFTEQDTVRDAEELTRTEVAQPALGATSLALADLLEACGIRPGVLAGHSYGEYVALARAGVLSADELIRLSFERGRCLRDAAAESPGAMLAVAGSEADVRRLLGERPRLSVANINSPRQTVLAGPDADLAEVVHALAAGGLDSRVLPVACAFHSPLVARAATAWRAVLADVRLRPPTLPVLANTTGAPYPADEDGIRALLIRHLVEPVRFLDQVEAMHAAGVRTFVEVGPRTVLSGLVAQTLSGRPHRVVATDNPARPGTTAFVGALARLFVAGHPVDPAPLTRGRATRPRTVSSARTAWLVDGGRSLPPTPPAGGPRPRTLEPQNRW